MQLGLRTKLTLVMTGLVFLVVVVLSAVFVARLDQPGNSRNQYPRQ